MVIFWKINFTNKKYLQEICQTVQIRQLSYLVYLLTENQVYLFYGLFEKQMEIGYTTSFIAYHQANGNKKKIKEGDITRMHAETVQLNLTDS